MPSTLILVKHAQPILDASVRPRAWRLGSSGEEQAGRLAHVLAPFMPFALASSAEPKAHRTAEIVGRTLGLKVSIVDGLHEFDRPALPLMSDEEHRRVNAAIFANPISAVLGQESAAEALDRFTLATAAALDSGSGRDTLVAVTHGTVIALFVAAHNDLEAYQLWTQLRCPSFVVLSVPDFRLIRVEGDPLRGAATR